MKIALINPSPTVNLEEKENQIVKRQETYPPLGLLYLGEILDRKGHNIKIFDQDVTGATPDDVLNWIKRRDPNLIGLSPLSISFKISMDIIKLIKNWNPNVKVVLGNIISTLCSDLIVKEYEDIDFCIRGEAEETLPELVDAIEKNANIRKLEKINGITFLENKKVKITPDRSPIQDLDVVPFPDREKLIDFDYRMGGKKFTILATSRGCPFSCKFCAIHINSGLKSTQRRRSLQNVIEELHYLENQGYKEINFVDDCFILNKKRTIDLCLMIRKEKIDLEWACEGRVDQASLKLLRTMKKARCKSILFGIESVNKKMLEYYNKNITPEISKKAVKNANKVGIENIIGLFILGGPREIIKEVIDTINFSLQLDLTFIQYQYLHILMGSGLWKELEKKGIVSRERDWKKYLKAYEVLPDVLSKNILDKLMIHAYARFLSRPKYLINQVLKTVTSNYRIDLIRDNIKALLKGKAALE
ncbi:MAG: radical SAM protein [Candidatus Lokiarchaeota archaeon]|nr:radical SAM protein [Candidatus Lokiarchaeota archaeon]